MSGYFSEKRGLKNIYEKLCLKYIKIPTPFNILNLNNSKENINFYKEKIIHSRISCPLRANPSESASPDSLYETVYQLPPPPPPKPPPENPPSPPEKNSPTPPDSDGSTTVRFSETT